MVRERAHLVRRALLAIVPLLLALWLVLTSPATAEAATIVVNSSGEDLDGTPPNGQCTLLEALNNANNNFQRHPDCVAGEGGGTIDRVELRISPGFDPNNGCHVTTRVCRILISGTYLLTDPVTIDGYTQLQAVPNTLAVGSNALIKILLLPQPDACVVSAFQIRANDVTIRGLAIGEFGQYGIDVASGFSARIVGCFIGIDPNGTQARGNSAGGIVVGLHDSGAVIGGSSPADRNLISGNNAAITLHNADTVTIRGNAIGTNAAGTGAIPNQHGVIIRGSRNLVGGTGPGEGNVIAYNAVSGIRVISGTGNGIVGNAIFANGGPGINLMAGVEDGVTLNDVGDGDVEPNDLQNFPFLSSVGVRVNTTIHGTLNSTPNRPFRVEIFSSPACEANGFGEGETYLGFISVTTDGSGNARFLAVLAPIPVGREILSTATDMTTGSTSEFSDCRRAVQTDLKVTNPVGQPITSLTTTEGGGVGPFAVGLATVPTANVTIPISVSDPTEGTILLPASPLTFTPASGTSAQQVRIQGVDDGIDDGNVVYAVVLGVASSADPNYNGLNPADFPVTNVDNDDLAAQCGPPALRPKVNVSVVKLGSGQLRATVSVTTNPGTQNEIQAIGWTKLTTATVVLDGVGPVQQGQASTFGPLTQSASFVVTCTAGAQSATVQLTVFDACGAWPTVVGGGPNAW